MNKRTLGLVILFLAVVALGIGLYVRHNKAVEETKVHVAAIQQLSNNWVNAQDLLQEQQRVNATLETNIVVVSQEVRNYSNTLSSVSANLAKVEAEAKAAAEAAAEEIKKRDARIDELETEIDEQTTRMLALTGDIEKLNVAISETERKLAASEGDREFLLKELQRLQSEKAELERQLNDLAFLRQQVRKLRDDLAVTRRLDMIRRGLYNVVKGGERLQSGIRKPTGEPPKPNADLNVEIIQDGPARVTPATNGAPTPTPPPPATNAAPTPPAPKP